MDTVIFHIDALTGANVRAVGEAARAVTRGVFEGFDIIQGPIVDAFLLDPPSEASFVDSKKPNSNSKKGKKNKFNSKSKVPVPTPRVVLLLDEFLQVYPYPDTPETQATLTHYADSLYFPLRAEADDGKSMPGEGTTPRRLLGHKLQLNDQLSDKHVAYPTWTFSLPPGEDIQAIVPPFRSSGASKGGAASFGKVLGNRTTLYKYLNPRMMVLLSSPFKLTTGQGKGTCGVYVLDSAKGTVIYHAALPTVDGGCEVKVSLVENWLVYHYYDGEVGKVPGGNGETKGWRVVTVELYEGNGADQKTRRWVVHSVACPKKMFTDDVDSSDMSAFSGKNADVLVLEQSYVYPHAITALTPTTTKFGIAVKDLIGVWFFRLPCRLLYSPCYSCQPQSPNTIRSATAPEPTPTES